MGGKERLRCAYCPYTTLHHDYIVQHSLEQHVCQVMCYGCLSKSFYSLRDLKDHIQRRHPQDPRAWGTYQFYSDKQRRTFLYFGRDVVTGKSRQYSFVSQDAVNECHGWLICAYVTHSYFNCHFYTHWSYHPRLYFLLSIARWSAILFRPAVVDIFNLKNKCVLFSLAENLTKTTTPIKMIFLVIITILLFLLKHKYHLFISSPHCCF